MLNELSLLSEALEEAGISTQKWHLKYVPIPNITRKAPCIRIIFAEGKIERLESIDAEQGLSIRKYGNNLQSFPAGNLVPLYRVTDEKAKREIREMLGGKIELLDVEEVRSWCVHDNWTKNIRNKVRRSLQDVPEELSSMLKQQADAEPIRTMIAEMETFREPEMLRQGLKEAAFRMLDHRVDVAMALQVLFHLGIEHKEAEKDVGTLSVVYDCVRLIDAGWAVASSPFTLRLNRALLAAEKNAAAAANRDAVLDAFGILFVPKVPKTPKDESEPMPSVKLAGGFEAKLRTMFADNRCHFRYKKAGSDSYPISPAKRLELQAALAWLGSAEQKHEHITWIRTDVNEILFAYPHALHQANASFVRAFQRMPKSKDTFEKEAEALIGNLLEGSRLTARVHPGRLQVFILRKVDKARTKVMYTRSTDPVELQERAAQWTLGCGNLPPLPFGQPETLFPMDVADVLNRMWKQDGTLATDKFKPTPSYRGMELLMEPKEPVTQDMAAVAKQCANLAGYLGMLALKDRKFGRSIWDDVKALTALCGLLLYRLQQGKEQYMVEFPYQLGQLLKVSDELHILYCKVVRNGDVPPQLAGSCLVQSAMESPVRTLAQLGQRMMPYCAWARSYRHHCLSDIQIAHERKDNPKAMLSTEKAGWLFSQFEGVAGRLKLAWSAAARLTDAEKAQLFLGYMAAFPRKEKLKDAQPGEMEKMNETEDNLYE